MKERCVNCKYLRMEKRSQLGGDDYMIDVCVRYAPRIIHGSGTGWSSDKFPEIDNPDEAWCREWEEMNT